MSNQHPFMDPGFQPGNHFEAQAAQAARSAAAQGALAQDAANAHLREMEARGVPQQHQAEQIAASQAAAVVAQQHQQWAAAQPKVPMRSASAPSVATTSASKRLPRAEVASSAVLQDAYLAPLTPLRKPELAEREPESFRALAWDMICFTFEELFDFVEGFLRNAVVISALALVVFLLRLLI